MKENILLIETNDEKGLVYKVAKALYDLKINIDENNEFVEKEENKFFMRTIISGQSNKDEIIKNIKAILPQNSKVQLVEQNRKKRVIVMVTKEAHCLGDLLIRNQFNELNMNIEAVIGNYDVLQDLTQRFDIPFHYVSHNNIDREEHEKRLLEVLKNYEFDYIVLAKYMRILSKDFVSRYENKIINIHHSFLPAFIGAKPYLQAYNRGVKIIGATSHFVNSNLDEGPIITQNVINVNHTHSSSELSIMGRDVEKIVLSKALKLVFEDRVFVYKNKTIIFE